jgi:tetratricopeptide (TPR) repeat protein
MTSDNDRLNLLLDLRRYADAERMARDAIGRDPQWAAGYTHLARALMGQNKADAVDAAREGARKAPHDAWAVGTLACVLNWFDRPKEALEPAEEAIRLDPQYAWAYAMLSNVLYNLGRYTDARQKAVQGLRFDPLSESLFRWKGWAEHKLGEQAEALRTAEEGLKHHPNSHLLLNLIGCVRWSRAEKSHGRKRLREHRAADALLRDSIRLDPTQPAYRDNLRGNAASCRKYLVTNGLTLVAIAAVLVPLLGLLVATPPGAPLGQQPLVGLLLPVGVCGLLSLLFVQSERFALSLPLDRFGVPSLPTTRGDRLFARFCLSGYALCLLVPYLILACLLL